MTDKQPKNVWLDEKADFKGKIGGQRYWIVKSRPWMAMETSNDPKVNKILTDLRDSTGYNGYLEFKKRPVRERGYNGIVAYVPVWGGITYAQESDDGAMIYGFDTCHIEQEKLPIRDPKWIKKQLRSMRDGLFRAKEVETKYLKAVSPKGKAKHAAYVFGENKPVKGLGFSALINLMTGEV